MADPNAVRQALAEHGIPALVTAGKSCRTADQPPPGGGEVVVLSHGQQHLANGQRPSPIVIYGSKIPSGVELSIGYRQDPQHREISFTLIQAGAPLTCTSIPDHGPHNGINHRTSDMVTVVRQFTGAHPAEDDAGSAEILTAVNMLCGRRWTR